MATKQGLSLSTVPDFPGEVVRQLAELWITTVEELASAAALEGGLAGLAGHTGLPESEVTRLVELARAALPSTREFITGEIRRHGLGALDEREPGETRGPLPPVPLPPRVDLHGQLGPIRDQGQRGTCVAFACTAVREFLTGEAGSRSDLSEQFLYWACKQHDLIAGAGTFIRVGMNRLEFDGIPAETVWPYSPHPIAGNEGQNPPPPGAQARATRNCIGSSTRLSPTHVEALRQVLAGGKPLAFAVPVYTYWFTDPIHATGDIRMPLPGEKVEGGHAMCMVGYETDPEVPGGGYFLVRNSWGTGWASRNPAGPGHARLPFAYLQKYGTSAYTASAGPAKPKSVFNNLLDWLRELVG